MLLLLAGIPATALVASQSPGWSYRLAGLLLLASVSALVLGIIGRHRNPGSYLTILVVLASLSSYTWFTRHPESTWLEEAQGWPVIGSAAERFREAYLPPAPTPPSVEASESWIDSPRIENRPATHNYSDQPDPHQILSLPEPEATSRPEPEPAPRPETPSESPPSPILVEEPESELPSSSAFSVFSLSVDVSELQIEVVVTDRLGKPILGLEEEDFQVSLDGRLAKIANLRYETRGSTTSNTAVQVPSGLDSVRDDTAHQPEKQRYFILLFHDLIFMDDKSTLGLLSQRMRAGRGIRRWVEEEMEAGDWLAVSTYDSTLRLAQDFTSDKEEILEAIDRVMSRSSSEGQSVSSGAPSLGAHLPTGKELVKSTTDFRRALKVLASAAGHTSGRKQLLLFTIGTDLEGQSSRAAFGPQSETTTIEALWQNEVAVYALDLTPRGVTHATLGDLQELAIGTGGIAFTQLQAFHKPLRTISNSLDGFYLLSIEWDRDQRPESSPELRVETRRKGLQVSARLANPNP